MSTDMLTALLLIAVVNTGLDAERVQRLSVGATVPDAAVEHLNGSAETLSQVIGGKPALIEFWATWCGVCKALKPTLEAAHRTYGDKVTFVTLAVADSQTRAEVSAFAAQHGLPGQVLYDSGTHAATAFGVNGTGYIFLVDPSGRITYAGVGPNQDVDAAIKSLLEKASE